MMVTYNPFLYVLILVLMMLAVAWLGTVIYLALRRRWKWALGLAVAGVAGPAWIVMMIFHPFGPVDTLRILDRAELAGGTSLLLTQSRNPGWTEPYTINLWVKPAEKPWGCLLIDHESRWWRRGRIKVAGERVSLLRGGQEFCSFTRQGGAFVTSEDDEPMTPFWVDRKWEPREGGEYRPALLDAAERPAAAAPEKESLNETRPAPEAGKQDTGESLGREQR